MAALSDAWSQNEIEANQVSSDQNLKNYSNMAFQKDPPPQIFLKMTRETLEVSSDKREEREKIEERDKREERMISE